MPPRNKTQFSVTMQVTRKFQKIYQDIKSLEFRSLLVFLNISHPFLFLFFLFFLKCSVNQCMSVILSIQTVHLRTKEMKEEDEKYGNSSPESADGTTVAVFPFGELSATRKSTNICLQFLSVPFDSTSECR